MKDGEFIESSGTPFTAWLEQWAEAYHRALLAMAPVTFLDLVTLEGDGWSDALLGAFQRRDDEQDDDEFRARVKNSLSPTPLPTPSFGCPEVDREPIRVQKANQDNHAEPFDIAREPARTGSRAAG